MYPEARIIMLDGRQLAVEDSGPESGFPIVVHNGAGSRHLFPPAVGEAQRYGFRLIGYDRPGCGGSTAMPGRVIADCAEDVRAIMSDLSISRMAVWGSSAGGPYALGTAAKLPEAVVAVCILASIGPYGMPGLDFADGMGDAFREEIRKFFDEPAQARAEFRAQAAEILAQQSSADWWLERWGERAGQDAAHSREWADYLAVCSRDGFGEHDQGWWDDWSASFLPWQFDVTEIQAPASCGTA